MVVSWDGSVSLIGFRGVAIGSLSGGGAGFLAGARRTEQTRGGKEGSGRAGCAELVVSFGNLKWRLAPSVLHSAAALTEYFLSSPFEALLF